MVRIVSTRGLPKVGLPADFFGEAVGAQMPEPGEMSYAQEVKRSLEAQRQRRVLGNPKRGRPSRKSDGAGKKGAKGGK